MELSTVVNKVNRIFAKNSVTLDKEYLVDVLRNWSLNDPAHHFEHLLDVLTYLDEKIIPFCSPSERDVKCALHAALLHDTQVHANREKHHILGAEYAAKMLFRVWETMTFTETESKIIVRAVQQHRASLGHARDGLVANMVSLADRGELCYHDFVMRTVKSKHHYFVKTVTDPVELENKVLDSVIDSMRRKFGADGYCWENFPHVPGVHIQDEIDKCIQNVEDELTLMSDIAELYDELYNN